LVPSWPRVLPYPSVSYADSSALHGLRTSPRGEPSGCGGDFTRGEKSGGMEELIVMAEFEFLAIYSLFTIHYYL
jgi:hypothetical protein